MHSQNTIGLWCNGNTTDSGPVIQGSNPGSPTRRRLFQVVFFLCWATRIRSACCASEELSSWCIGGAPLCDYDANSRYRQVNKFPRQYRLFTSDLWSCTTSPLFSVFSRLLPPFESHGRNSVQRSKHKRPLIALNNP